MKVLFNSILQDFTEVMQDQYNMAKAVVNMFSLLVTESRNYKDALITQA